MPFRSASRGCAQRRNKSSVRNVKDTKSFRHKGPSSPSLSTHPTYSTLPTLAPAPTTTLQKPPESFLTIAMLDEGKFFVACMSCSILYIEWYLQFTYSRANSNVHHVCVSMHAHVCVCAAHVCVAFECKCCLKMLVWHVRVFMC